MCSRNEIGKQGDNMEQEEAKVNIEETTINLSCIKKELDEDEFEFDENCYKLTLTFDNIFGESSKEQRDNKDSLIGFFDDEVVMEIETIKLEGVKDEEDLIREIMEQSDCNKCGGNYEGYCLDCSSLSHILNNLTPNINPEPILNTVPINTLEIREVSQRKAVFALKTLPKGVILGPFEGVAPIESITGLQWKIKDKKLVHDRNANWMQYIKSVTSHALKNLDIIHFDGILFFETTRNIQQGEELLVCYHEERDQVLKSDNEEELYLVPVKKEIYPKVFACTLCCLSFRLETCLMEHKNKCPHRDHRNRIEDFEITQCHYCKVWLVKQEYLGSHLMYCQENCNRSRRSFQPTEEISTSIDGSARDSTESELIQSKRSYGISGKRHAKEHPSTKENNINTSIKRFHSGFCKKKFTQQGSLKTHVKDQHSKTIEKKYKCSECDICKRKFSRKGNLKRHKENKHLNRSEKKYECTECSFQTNYKNSLNNHIVIHSNIKAFECNICERKFSTKGNMKKHIKNCHSKSNKKEYKCSKCSFQTNFKTNFDRHSILHSGIKPFECDICKMKFTEKGNLKMHIENQHLNIGEEKYKCSECSFRTNYRGNLKKHIVVHSGIKPFECDICKRKFTQKSSLNKHIRSQH